MRKARFLLVTAMLFAAPARSGAEQLEGGVQTEVLYTDNVFGTVENTLDDTSGRVAPFAAVADREGRLRWNLRYEPAYEYYVDQSGLRGWDHDVRAGAQFHLNGSTTFRVSDSFSRYRSLSRFNDFSEAGDEVNVVGFRQRFKRNRAAVGLTHMLSAIETLTFDVNYNTLDFSNVANADRANLGTNLSYNRQLSERTTVGSSFGWSRATFQRANFDERSTDFYNLSGYLAHSFDSSTRLVVSLGPTLIESESQSAQFEDDDPDTDGTQVQRSRFPLAGLANGNFRMLDADSCPKDEFGDPFLAATCETFPPDLSPQLVNSDIFRAFVNTPRLVDVEGEFTTPSDSRLTYFAAASFQKDWERWQARLGYTRSFSDATSAAAVSDIVWGRLVWDAARRLTVELGLSWERQEQASENSAQVLIVANETVPPAGGVLPPQGAALQAIRIQQLDSDASRDFLRASLRFNYQLTKRSSTFLTLNWRQENVDGEFVDPIDVDRWVVGVGVNYRFDPLQF